MFLNPSRQKTQGAFAAIGAFALIAACDDPSARTELRPEGDPEVLAVLVLNDSVSGLVEGAAYCAVGDEKRPSLVGLPDFTTSQVCPEDLSQPAPMLTNAAPDTFYVRIMFDELLDPNIEELIPILDENDQETGSFTGTLINTQPVTFKCTGVDGQSYDVPYDGYYSPSGNNVTWPLGPSLVIKQLGEFVIPTNSECEITLKDNITDKDGNPVPANQRGPYKFRVAPITPIFIDPADGDEVNPSALYVDNVYVQFNTAVDETSFCDEGAAMDECEFEFTPDLGGAGVFPLVLIGFTPAEFVFYPNEPAMEKTEYTFQFKEGTKIRDACGVETTFGAPSVDDHTKITVTTKAFTFLTTSPANGDVVRANQKLSVNFNNVIDLATLEASEYSLTPAPVSGGVASTTGANAFFFGHFAPETEYTLTINAGATVADYYGVVYTFAEAKTIKFRTQPIAITASSPANGATVTKATPTSLTTISFSFNQSMDPATWTADDVELTGPAPSGLTFNALGCTATGTSCSLRVQGVFVPGEYTLTLKAGATINDVLGNTYTQAEPRTIKFTVEDAQPGSITPCLGE